MSISLISIPAPGAQANVIQPFRQYTTNPSWLAVKPLHDQVLYFGDASGESFLQLQPVQNILNVVLGLSSKPRPIHITAVQIPVVYDSVLHIVPDLHARPPVLPESKESPTETSQGPPPEGGYDLIIHVGVGLPGNLEVEKQAHKVGYTLTDHEGKLPPVCGKNKRGFSGGCYEVLDEELKTEIDVDALVATLKNKFDKVRFDDMNKALISDFFSLLKHQRILAGSFVTLSIMHH